MIQNKNFYAFLKESEFRYNIRSNSEINKLDEIFAIFKYISDTSNNEPLDINALQNNEY